jgi:hypothetical protein
MNMHSVFLPEGDNSLLPCSNDLTFSIPDPSHPLPGPFSEFVKDEKKHLKYLK